MTDHENDELMIMLGVVLEAREHLLDTYCTSDWFYKLDIEDGVGINLSIPKFKKGVDDD